MGEFVVNVGSSTLECSAAGRLTGQLNVRIGSVAFPDDKWNDSIAVVLTWWLEEMSQSTQDRQAVFRFMDGPYEIRLDLSTQECYFASLFDDGVLQGKFDSRINRKEIIQELLRASSIVLTNAQARDWRSSELTGLESASRALQLNKS